MCSIFDGAGFGGEDRTRHPSSLGGTFVGIRISRAGEVHEFRYKVDAEQYMDFHAGDWRIERTPVPLELIPGFLPPTQPKRTLRERSEKQPGRRT
jgi:hypothetical protein